MEIRVLGAEEMFKALEMKSLIEEMKTAFLELSSGLSLIHISEPTRP